MVASRGRDLGGLERKIRAAGRAWTMGDVVMIADGQWAVHTKSCAERVQDAAVEARLAEGRRVELSLDELARVVGAGDLDAHRDHGGN
ncbi:hypothetical protein [Kitasatospora sp. LaBMicrA B282]|uniref:hypothetical protein n=1 Tax=Kitasatospora sp. LaBMicrA B282 TaxID=3420949 RepID=UPI003D0BD007